MEKVLLNLKKVILISASSFAGLWLILETLSYFGIKLFENTGIIGYGILIQTSIFLGLSIVFIKSIIEKNRISSLSEILLTEFSDVYTNKREAELHIKTSIYKSSTVKIFAGRGNELQRETYSRLFEAPNKFTSIHILLSNPQNLREKIDWLDQREKEIISFDKSFTKNTLRGQVKTNIDFLKTTVLSNSNFNLRLYNVPHIGLITITDNAVFYYFLKENGHGRDCMMFKCNVGTEMYKSLNRYFNEIWKNSVETK